MKVLFKTLALAALMPVFLPCAQADGGEIAPSFRDVRVGEQPGIARVAIICGGPCSASQDVDGRFFLSGVSGELGTDLSARGGFVTALAMETVSGGALLEVETRLPAEKVSFASCGAETVCLDFAHPPAPRPVALAPAVSAPAVPAAGDAARPAPPPANEPARKPAASPPKVLPKAPAQDRWVPQIAAALETASPAPLTPGNCGIYQKLLQDDAWDLEAYKMVALCKAAGGALQEADGLLARLQTLLPDDETADLARPAIAALANGRAALSGAPDRKAALRDLR